MLDEGRLTVELTLGEGLVQGLRIRSTRSLDVVAILAGRPVDEAVKMAPLLFSLCGTAHGLAVIEAAETALGVTPPPAHRAAREVLQLLDLIEGHGWSILLDWPKLVGEAPETRGYASLRRQTARLRSALYPDGDALRIGAGRLAPQAEVMAETAAMIARVLGQHVFGGPTFVADAPDFRAWGESRITAAARLVDALFVEGFAADGAGGAPLLVAPEASWFAERLATDPSFGVAPSRDGSPAEIGALATMQGDPLVRRVTSQWGAGLAARFAARLAELAEASLRLTGAVASLEPCSPGDVGSPSGTGSGEGAGLAATSRGALAYWLRIRDGNVQAIRNVAPTEWNFHPDGSLAQALRGSDADRAPRRAELLVAALDPCVPCRIALRDAATGAEARHA